MVSTSPAFVRTNQEIIRLADVLSREPCIGLDTESDSMYHYREKVCLIQLSSAETGTLLIDPLAGVDVGPLGKVMAAPGVTKIIHGADFDITSLKRDFGWTFAGVFDSVLAAKFLGWPSVGLAAVILREFGVKIEKGPQTADWSRRPLPDGMLRYASGDVDYLIEIHRRMVDYLKTTGRLDWVLQESAAVAQIQAASEFPAPADFLRATGAMELDPEELAVLKRLFDLREQVARHVDRPRFKVVPDETLIRIARTRPTDTTNLGSIRSVPRNIVQNPRQWLDAVRAGIADPPVQIPRNRRKSAWDPLIGESIDRLKRLRTELSERYQLDPGLLLPQRLVVAVATAAPADIDELRAVPGLHDWRCDEFGNQLLQCVRRRQDTAGHGR